MQIYKHAAEKRCRFMEVDGPCCAAEEHPVKVRPAAEELTKA